MAKKKKLKHGGVKQNGTDTLVVVDGSIPSSSILEPDKLAADIPVDAKTKAPDTSKQYQNGSSTKNVKPDQLQGSGNCDQEKPSTSKKFQETNVIGSSKINKPGTKKFEKREKERVMAKMEQSLSLKKKKIKDPRLIPRMREYLDSRTNKNFVSIPLMAEYLQSKYHDYARKKRSMFVQYVDKAYSYMEKPTSNDPPPPLSDTDENSGMEIVSQDGQYVWKKVSEHSRDTPEVANEAEDNMDEVTVDNDSETSEDDDEDLVEYQDTNAMNSSLMSLYRNNPANFAKTSTPADNKKRKAQDTPDLLLKRSKDDSKVVYPSPNVLDRNLASTGLVGPRRTASDKYFIDRKGDNSVSATDKSSVVKETREVTIQRFLGNLPSRTSYSAYVTGKNHPAGSLYRVFTGKQDSEVNSNLTHSGITPDNVGVSKRAPKSPSNQYEDLDVVILDDPRKQIKRGKEKKEESVINESNQDIFTKEKANRTPRKKKGNSRSRRQDDSDPEESKKIKGLDVQKSTVKFEDVGGNEATLTEICKLLVHMRHPEVYQQLGVTPPRGFLLHGPPGCGKTLLANAIAGELDLPMIKIAATEIVSGVSGDSEEKIRDLFDKATQNAPCVVFIDEIDSITPKRETASKDMERRIVAQLLACMDDLNANPGCHVLVIGATNRPDSLDPALRRAGRFDREISLGIPDEKSRLRILEVLCRSLRLLQGFDFAYLARNTPGYVGADLMALAREAAMTAVNRVFQGLQTDGDKLKLPQTSDGSTSSDKPTELTVHNENSSRTSDCQSVFSSSSIVSACISQPETRTCSINSTSLTGLNNATLSHSLPDSIMTSACSSGSVTSSNSALLSPTKNVTDSDVTKEMQNIENNNVINYSENLLKSSANMSKQDKRTSAENTVASVLSIDSDLTGSVENANETLESNVATMEVDNEHINAVEAVCKTSAEPSKQEEAQTSNSHYLSVLSWLKDHPPLTEAQLADLYITMEDFKEALKYVQPSAKREGFATIPDVTWDDIGALHEVREELELAILAPVRHAEQFKSLGLTRAQGVLLAGPPGCGKTLLAKAIANESGINFISVKGPELLNMYVGESERAVRTVFQRARNSAPCVIFFDELDALCPKRSGSSEGNSSARVVNQLLTEMDGLEERKQVFIMAATNRPDIIDPAVLRPGRLDKTLYVGLPTETDRLDILRCITKDGSKPRLGGDVLLSSIAADPRCNCYTGADLAALVREASVAALKQAIVKGQQPSDVIIVRGEHFETAFRKTKPSVTPKDQEKYNMMKTNLSME